MSIFTIFRSCVVIVTLLYVTYWFLPFSYGYLDYETGNLLSYGGHDALVTLPEYFDYVMLCTWQIIAVGLYFYSNAARIAFALLLIAFTAISPLLGLSVETAGGISLISLMSTLDGAIFVFAFFTPVSARFAGSNKSLNQTGAHNAPPG